MTRKRWRAVDMSCFGFIQKSNFVNHLGLLLLVEVITLLVYGWRMTTYLNNKRLIFNRSPLTGSRVVM